MKKISILGATGSIGTQTLDVMRRDRENFKLVGISARKNVYKLMEIIDEFHPEYVVLNEKAAYDKIKEYCSNKSLNIEILFGVEGLNTIASLEEVDIVVTSVVGIAGLVPTLEAIKSGKVIALANKETLVAGGKIVIDEMKKHNASIVPVDSEHGAIFQCLRGNEGEAVSRILLTASGGPFRGKKKNDLEGVTVEEALNHPKWNMGKKLTVDSATFMNKGLEVIEAHWLFNVPYEKIQVVVHPESVVHSMVEYVDGSVIAQLGSTDMRLPIQYALNYPERKSAVVDRLDFYRLNELHFEKPDMDTFRPLRFAYEAGESGGTMPAILNCANEEAVSMFLEGRIKFLDIMDILEDCMNKFEKKDDYTLEDILELNVKIKEYMKLRYCK
ncbi:MAG: 1-deoxy-D-xylulose-5-phosphate reductoisomerase [Clostridium sp.]|uniref:1-deoxy-D-xylulose-5-phosphate reductoisomerase n=1 Tax=Clostridium sp. TaxID=1506 RepID=UPI0025BF14F4|nr:1-deoxy-D-xylulose-5-phosphate reductoisomerase [Clostridium sp.]MCH3963990.1 1-deoxy-D-xylulose-5-phosphate reductoisomerase [Clostridium sp.]MCI1716191.1 1-deoxy-D-xylulose-5-phosphate reductoisomerase [Clostridium sp.]MCI1800569.1 1-deoxy-D-xylulose-5-phosphate reductoisomerase [Clostridium sp.]MCI1814368.1 1-deoxy-D-xylulose-5-phosphate reductoisomerase [Clostridium sp.]MCI1871267.1 1-deoxy-D-xylulose-5-phosphate reductoisomerase [Clostridium sp.]